MKNVENNKSKPKLMLFAACFVITIFLTLFIFPISSAAATCQIENDHIAIGEKTYSITGVDTLVDADLALLEWRASGSEELIHGKFDGAYLEGFEAVYNKVYDMLLEEATSTISNGTEFYSDQITNKTTVIVKIESGATATIDGTARVIKGGGRLIVVAEDKATMQVTSQSATFKVGDSSGTGTLVIQGRNKDNEITLTAKDKVEQNVDTIYLQNGNLYLQYCNLTEFTFIKNGGTKTFSMIRLPKGNFTRFLYMSDSSMTNITGKVSESSGIMCQVYVESGDETKAAASKLFINYSLFDTCTVLNEDKAQARGGAVIRSYAADRCDLLVQNSTFSNNLSGHETNNGTGTGGGAIYWKSVKGKAILKNCIFTNNHSNTVGGAILNTGTMEIEKCRFEGNTALQNGGAIAVEPPYSAVACPNITANNGHNSLKGTLTLDSDTKVINNRADGSGGGIYFNAYASKISTYQINKYEMELIIEGAEISDNTANYGGGVAMWLNFEKRNYTTGITIAEDSTIKNNTANIDGGAIWMGSAVGCKCKNDSNVVSGVNMNSGTLEGNKALAGSGGAIFIDVGDPTATMDFNLNGGTVKSNWAQNSGGAAYIKGGNFTMSGGSMEDCYTVAQNGGAIYMSSGKFTMTAGEIKNCRTEDTGSGNGGAVYMAAGTFDMSGGDITNCHSETGSGGGVYLGGGTFNLGGGSITSCTAVNGNGGGVYLGGGKLNVTSGELLGNSARDGGGAYVNAATVDDGIFVSGGIISGNTAAQNGGGVAVNNGTYKMTGGSVTGNNATSGSGGGIYVSAAGVDVVVEIRSGAVTQNTAGISGGAVAVVGQKDGTEKITVTVGVNKEHFDSSGNEIDCDHSYDGKSELIYDCPVVTQNGAGVSGGGVYITGGKETHLNTYCMEELGNHAGEKNSETGEYDSQSNFMMVEGGTVVISTADSTKAGNSHGKMTINNTIHVYAGDMDIYGSMINPLILGAITVDVTVDRGEYDDHRQNASTGGTEYVKVQYFENFKDPTTGKSTGRYTVFSVVKGSDHTILPALYEHAGYEIEGWWTTPEIVTGSVEYPVNSTHAINADLKLWAQWLPIGYYVYFEPGTDGTYRGEMERERYTHNISYTLPKNMYFIAGMAFVGWDKNGDNIVDFTDAQTDVSNLTLEKEITLTALWTACTHTNMIVSKTAGNVLERTCVCEACTQTATLTAEDSVYTGSKQSGANLRITGGSNNGQPTPAWNVPIVHSGINYSDVTISEGDLLTAAGRYTAVISDYVTGLSGEAVSAEVQFEIKKADRPNPAKPKFSSHETNAEIEEGKIVILEPDDAEKEEFRYKIVWYDEYGGNQETKSYSDVMDEGFSLTTNYTNYYVYVMFPGDDNHNDSEWVKSEEVLFYVGNVYIFISGESGIEYTTQALEASRGLIIYVTPADGYYLYNVEINDDNASTVISDYDGFTQTYSGHKYYMASIPTAEVGQGAINIHVSITGVKKKVNVTASTVAEGEVFGQVKSDSAAITCDSAYTAYFEIENYELYTDPRLYFGGGLLPKGATVILIDKSCANPVYWSYRVETDDIAMVPFSSFRQMGTVSDTPVSLGATIKYQVVVDFSDSAGMNIDNLKTTFVADNPLGVPAFPDNGKAVTLEAAPTTSMSVTDGNSTMQKQVTVTYPEGSAASSKWLGTSAALILDPTIGVVQLPADARIEAVDEQGNRTQYYRNVDNRYIIPMKNSDSVTLSLISDVIGTSAGSWPFAIQLVSAETDAVRSAANGTALGVAQEITFSKTDDATPAIGITINNEQGNILAAGSTLSVTVEAQNQPDGTSLYLRLLSKDTRNGVQGNAYIDTGWKATSEDPEKITQVPLGDTPAGSCCLVLELRNAAGDVMISTEYYFVIQ